MKRVLTLIIFVVVCNVTNAQWTQINFPTKAGGPLLASDGNYILAAGLNSGLFMSNDNGLTWIVLNSAIKPNEQICSLMQNGSNIYAGSYQGNIWFLPSLESSWTNLITGMGDNYNHLPENVWASSIAIYNHGSDNNLLIGTQGGYDFRQIGQDNGGIFFYTPPLWIQGNYGLMINEQITALSLIGKNMVLGTYGHGVFISNDTVMNVLKWNAANNGLSSQNISSLAVYGTKIYVGTYDDNGGLFLSTDNGSSWSKLFAQRGSNISISSIVVNGSNIFICDNHNGIFYSPDNGSSWNQINLGLTTGFIKSLIIHGDYIFAASDQTGLIFRRPLSEIITSVPSKPNLFAPNNGATGQLAFTTLSWNASYRANNYTLQLSTNNTFSNFLYNQSGLTDTSQQITGLSNLTTYYWRVSATNNIGISDWSDIWSFTTTGTVLSIPTLSLPSNGSTGQSITPTLSWHSSSGATNYSLQVSTNNSFTSYIVNQSGLTDTSKQITGLTNLTTYYWRVSATNNSRTSDWSNIWSFTTIGSTSNSCTGSITYAGQTYNLVQIGNQCWLKENLNVGTMIDSTSDQANNGIIEKYCYHDSTTYCNKYGGLYQWAEAIQYLNGANDTTTLKTPLVGNVQGICPSGWHIPSITEFQTLTTTVNNDGDALKAIGQGFNNGVGTNTSKFSALFSSVRFLDGSFAEFGIDASFWSSSEINTNCAAPIDLFPANNIVFFPNNWGKKGGFNIRCLNDNFFTITETNTGTELPTNYSVSQNYPNPFNPATTINYSIPKSGLVTIKVYDILGREVTTLVNDNKPAGNYSAKFDGSKLVSGIYFYRMQSGNFSQTKKLLLLK